MKRLTMAIAVCMFAALTACALAGCATQDYTPEGKASTVDSGTLIEDGVLRVGVTTESNTPFVGEVSGTIVGIDIDIAAALADEMGLTLEIVDVGTDLAAALEEGTVDIVMGMDDSTVTDACWMSDIYIESGVALFAKTDVEEIPTAESSSLIAAQSSSMSAWPVSSPLGADSLYAPTDLKGAFEAVEEGTVLYAAADVIIGTYAAYASGINVDVLALLESPGGYCIGALASNDALTAAVEAALANISDGGVIAVIENKWLGTSIDLSDVTSTVASTTTTEATEDETEE